MKNWFSWVGQSIVLGSLLAGTVAVGGAIAAPDPAFRPILRELKRSSKQTIESLPDGRYIYGIEKKRKYLSFLKQGDMVFGEHGVSSTDNNFCIFGKISKNEISNAKLVLHDSMYLGNGKVKVQYEVKYIALNFDEYQSQRGYVNSHSFDDNLDTRDRYIDRCLAILKKELNVSPENSAVKQNDSSRDGVLSTPIAPPQPVTSRPPNAQEIALLDRTIQDSKVPSLSRSQSIDRQTLQSKSSKFMKPFVGGWLSADNQKYYIYPSTRKDRQACILIEKDGIQDLQIGVANGNNSGTDINIGTARMFKTQDSKTVALRVPGGEALVPLYASAISADITPGNLEMMQQNGCMTSFPGLTGSAITTKPKQPDSPKQSSGDVCPAEMFAATVPPRKEYGYQSPSYAFVETAGSNQNGTGLDGVRKILPHIRCNFLKSWNNPSAPQRTWLIIHGWNDGTSSDTSDTVKLAKTIAEKHPNDRVLSLDWSEASNNRGRTILGQSLPYRGVYYAATWIRPVAEATVAVLREKYGIDDVNSINDLNIVGHSLGSLMSAEIGSLYSNGVNSITALDPASELSSLGDLYSKLGGYDVDGRTPSYKQVSALQQLLSLASTAIPGRDFIPGNVDRPKCFSHRASQQSINSSKCDRPTHPIAKFTRAFVGQKSLAGNQGFATSANESYQIDFGDLFDFGDEHGRVVSTFTELTRNNWFSGFLGTNDLKPHPSIQKGSDGHSGIINMKTGKSFSQKMIFLEHSREGSLSIAPDGVVYHRPQIDKILDFGSFVKAGSVQSIFGED